MAVYHGPSMHEGEEQAAAAEKGDLTEEQGVVAEAGLQKKEENKKESGRGQGNVALGCGGGGAGFDGGGFQVQPQLAFTVLLVRPVAGEAVPGQQRLNLPLKVHRLGASARSRQGQQYQRQEEAAWHGEEGGWGGGRPASIEYRPSGS